MFLGIAKFHALCNGEEQNDLGWVHKDCHQPIYWTQIKGNTYSHIIQALGLRNILPGSSFLEDSMSINLESLVQN